MEQVWAVKSMTVFLAFLFKELGDHSAIVEALKRLMYLLYSGNYIFFYSKHPTDYKLKALVFNI